jgi:hypothetical protein
VVAAGAGRAAAVRARVSHHHVARPQGKHVNMFARGLPYFTTVYLQVYMFGGYDGQKCFNDLDVLGRCP